MNAITYPTTDAPTVSLPRVTAPRPRAIDAAKLWTGGLATAAVAALIGLVGVLVVRVLAQVVPNVGGAALLTSSGTALLCAGAAGAAMAATGLAHLLLLSTPRPLSFLGWIVGLATTVAAVLPLTAGLPLPVALAGGVINLIVGLAIGSLVAGAALAATRTQGNVW